MAIKDERSSPKMGWRVMGVRRRGRRRIWVRELTWLKRWAEKPLATKSQFRYGAAREHKCRSRPSLPEPDHVSAQQGAGGNMRPHQAIAW